MIDYSQRACKQHKHRTLLDRYSFINKESTFICTAAVTKNPRTASSYTHVDWRILELDRWGYTKVVQIYISKPFGGRWKSACLSGHEHASLKQMF